MLVNDTLVLSEKFDNPACSGLSNLVTMKKRSVYYTHP